MNLLFLPKLIPRADIIGGPILVYHRIKNLSLMGHKITVIAPAYSDVDRKDTSLEPYSESIIRIPSVRQRPQQEVEELHKRLNRPRFFLNGDGGFCQGIEDALKLALKENHIDSIVAEYSMMGQYIEANQDSIPADTMSVISVHECYTRAFKMRAAKGEEIGDDSLPQARKPLARRRSGRPIPAPPRSSGRNPHFQGQVRPGGQPDGHQSPRR